MALHRPQDTETEKRVAAVLAQQYGMAWKLAPAFACYDVEFRDHGSGRIKVIAEVKRRRFHWSELAEAVNVGKRKIDECLDEAAKRACLFWFAVECASGIYATRLDRKRCATMRTKIGGRCDRGRPEDTEEMILVPIQLFVKVSS